MREDTTLADDGIVVVRQLGGIADFWSYAAKLGALLAEEDIALREGAHAYVARPGAVPLHTDHPDVDVIGWFCHAQDQDDGASWFLDTRPVLAELPTWVVDELRRTRLLCQPVSDGDPMETRPVLRGPRERLYHPPWRLEPEPITWNRAAHRLLIERLESAERSARIDVRLAPGDAVFIDNTRVLHGRGAIAANSPRRLTRAWLRRPA